MYLLDTNIWLERLLDQARSAEPEDTDGVINAIKRFKLDFDDAYHYAATGKYSLTLVSFDTDFDQTDLERKTPAEISR